MGEWGSRLALGGGFLGMDRGGRREHRLGDGSQTRREPHTAL